MALVFRQDLLTRLWLLYALAALSFLTTLHLPYVGEEGVYTITSLEMGFRHAACGPLVRSSYHADQQAHGAGVA